MILLASPLTTLEGCMHIGTLNWESLGKELMYQQVICRFAQFNTIQLSEPAPVQELLITTLRDEDLESAGDYSDDLRKYQRALPGILCGSWKFLCFAATGCLIQLVMEFITTRRTRTSGQH